MDLGGRRGRQGGSHFSQAKGARAHPSSINRYCLVNTQAVGSDSYKIDGVLDTGDLVWKRQSPTQTQYSMARTQWGGTGVGVVGLSELRPTGGRRMCLQMPAEDCARRGNSRCKGPESG